MIDGVGTALPWVQGPFLSCSEFVSPLNYVLEIQFLCGEEMEIPVNDERKLHGAVASMAILEASKPGGIAADCDDRSSNGDKKALCCDLTSLVGSAARVAVAIRSPRLSDNERPRSI